MDLSNYILQGFKILPKITVSVNGGQIIDALLDTTTHRDEKSFGGFEPNQQAWVSIETRYLNSPKTLQGKIVVMNSESWRIRSIRYGDSITTLELISTDKL